MKQFAVFAVIGLLVLNACKDDVDPIPIVPVFEDPAEITDSSFLANWFVAFSPERFEMIVATDNNFIDVVQEITDIPGEVRSQRVAMLEDNTVYYYRVRGVNGATPSVYSPFGIVTTLPSPPVASAATDIGPDRFTARWERVDDLLVYVLDVSESADFSTFVPGFNSMEVIGEMWLVGGLESNTTYYYRVRAKGAGLSNFSGTIEVTTLP